MRKRRCNPTWDHMNKSAYHPVLLYLEKHKLEKWIYRKMYTTR